MMAALRNRLMSIRKFSHVKDFSTGGFRTPAWIDAIWPMKSLKCFLAKPGISVYLPI